MSYFARIESGVVQEVLVAEAEYIAGKDGVWVEAFDTNPNPRKNFASVGFTYDAERDAFIAPKPSEDAELDENCKWVEPPPDDPILSIERASAWERIKAERDRRQHAGVKVGAKWFHSDDSSRIQQLGLVMMGAGIPSGLQWKSLDGSFVTMTQTLAGQIFQSTAVSDVAIFGVAEAHKAAMLGSADPANYDYSGGWPATFAG